ncbi:MAG: hypothetical protein ACM3SM_01505 [Bacteroidota bacterium]
MMIKNEKILFLLIRVSAGFIMLLGIAHAAIAVPMGITATASLSLQDSAPLTMANIVTAAAVFLSGLLVYCNIQGMKRNTRGAFQISLASFIFMFLVGVGYRFATPDNPFAYLASLFPVVGIYSLMSFAVMKERM